MPRGFGFNLAAHTTLEIITFYGIPLLFLQDARPWVSSLTCNILEIFIPALLLFISTDDKGPSGRYYHLSARLPWSYRISYFSVNLGDIKTEANGKKLLEQFFRFLIIDLTCHIVNLQGDLCVIWDVLKY